ELTLLSGNPVSFRQAIYEAYYVARPEVPVEVAGRVLPKPDSGVLIDQVEKAADMKSGGGQLGGKMRGFASAAPPPPAAAPAGGPREEPTSVELLRARSVDTA